jgi:lipoprotein NlpD
VFIKGIVKKTVIRSTAVAQLALLSLCLAGCAEQPIAEVEDRSVHRRPITLDASAAPMPAPSATQGTYHVAAGDTLYAIAFKNGVDHRDLAQWNHIPAPYRIYAGQELRVTGPESPSTAGAVPIAGAPVTVAISEPAAPARVTPITATAATPRSGATAPAMSTPPTTAPFVNVTPAVVASKPAAVSSTVSAPQASPPPTPTVAKPLAPVPEPAIVPAKPSSLNSEPPSASLSSLSSASGNVLWRWPGNGPLIAQFSAGDPTRQGLDIAGKAGDRVIAAADGSVVYSGNGLLGYGELIIIKHNASFLSAYGHNRKRLVQEGETVKAGQQIAEMGTSTANRDLLHFEIRRNGRPVNPLDFLPSR